ncbi:MAG: lipoate--protein ligase family protein [Candidatus Helarchaeota archaeon]
MSAQKPWRVLILENQTPLQSQLIWHACSLSLSEQKSPPNLLILQSLNGKIMSCGFHQDVEEELDLDACKSFEMPYTRRLAGGGTVLVDEDQILFNVLLPGFQFPNPLHNLIKVALPAPNKLYNSLGIPATIDYNEIEVRGRKISGSGSASIEKVGLLVGNILLNFNVSIFLSCLNMPSENFKKLAEMTLENYITSIQREIEEVPSRRELIDLLLKEYERDVGASFSVDELNEAEMNYITELEPVYGSIKWLFRSGDKKQRFFLKIKKDVFIFHHEESQADFLIGNGKIGEVLTDSSNPKLEELKGKSIRDISTEEFGALKESLERCRFFSNR